MPYTKDHKARMRQPARGAGHGSSPGRHTRWSSFILTAPERVDTIAAFIAAPSQASEAKHRIQADTAA